MPQLNGLSFDGLIDFISVDLTPFGDEVRRFVNSSTYLAGSPELSGVTWQNVYWQPAAFQTGGYQRGGENLVRPAVSVPDFTGELYVILRSMNLGSGASVLRYRALWEDVRTNVAGAAFSQEQYLLYNVARAQNTLQLELATPVDAFQNKIPGFKMMREDYPGLNSAILRG